MTIGAITVSASRAASASSSIAITLRGMRTNERPMRNISSAAASGTVLLDSRAASTLASRTRDGSAAAPVSGAAGEGTNSAFADLRTFRLRTDGRGVR